MYLVRLIVSYSNSSKVWMNFPAKLNCRPKNKKIKKQKILLNLLLFKEESRNDKRA